MIRKIVLTGGPCAGKTTALDAIVENFTRLGFKVFTVPEVPTMFTKGGMNYVTDNKEFFYEGEKATLEIQLALEDKFFRLAETQTVPTLVVCDRGTLDISAYMTPEMWNEIIQKVGVTTEQMLSRYDAVLHLKSAADGLEECYNTDSNAQRYESADEAGLSIARQLEHKVMKAWEQHHNRSIIGTDINFGKKLANVIECILKLVKE